MRNFYLLGLLLSLAAVGHAAPPVPVRVPAVSARHGLVVAGHPQAAAAGLAVLKARGNAIDAAIATSLALGVAEPYASGLGGKLVMLYFEASSGRTYALDALDAGGTFYPESYLRLAPRAHEAGFSAVCVPGLPAGLWLAHERWGSRPWAELVRPAIELARGGAEILPKTREFFAEEEGRLRASRELSGLFLPGDALPAAGSRLKNEDLARTLELLASGGRDAFYRGELMKRMVAESRRRGGHLTAASFAAYEARIVEPIGVDFLGRRVLSAPPPSDGAPLLLATLKAFERERFAGAPLRRPDNLDRLGRVWRVLESRMRASVGDTPAARAMFEELIKPESILRLRSEALGAPLAATWDGPAATGAGAPEWAASTTHFIVVDEQGNVACVTQSLGVHFGAGVVVKGMGFALNNSMANFDYEHADSPNAPAPGRRPATTMAPTLVLKDGRPELAIGAPGSSRIPSALLQVLLDRLVLDRPLRDAIGDTRVHFFSAAESRTPAIEVEAGPLSVDRQLLEALGWRVFLGEAAGTGHRFGGVNAVEITPRGKLKGYADPRRTNAVAEY